jgi:DNA primase
MPPIDLRQVRSEIRLGSVLGLLGWRATQRSGEQVRGPCPVHGAKSATSRSFSAHLRRGVWRCFACGVSGNALDLWVNARGQGLYPAVLELYRRLGQQVPWLVRSSPQTKDKQDMKSG